MRLTHGCVIDEHTQSPALFDGQTKPIAANIPKRERSHKIIPTIMFDFMRSGSLSAETLCLETLYIEWPHLHSPRGQSRSSLFEVKWGTIPQNPNSKEPTRFSQAGCVEIAGCNPLATQGCSPDHFLRFLILTLPLPLTIFPITWAFSSDLASLRITPSTKLGRTIRQYPIPMLNTTRISASSMLPRF